MEPIHFYFVALGASLALSLAGMLVVFRNASILPALRWCTAGVFAAGMAHSILSGPVLKDLSGIAGPVLTLLSVGGVLLLWVVVRLLFDERFALKRESGRLLALFIAGAVAPIAAGVLARDYKAVAMLVVAVFVAALVVHMLWILVAGRSDDLDAYRRWLRLLLAGGCSLYIAVVLGANYAGLLHGKPVMAAIWLACGQSAFKLAWLLLVTGEPSPMGSVYRITSAASPSPLETVVVVPEAQLVSARAGQIDGWAQGEEGAQAPETQADGMPTVSEAVALRQAAAILAAMTDEKLYRQQGLSIGRLSDHVGLPEHRVRSLINGHLQFKNYTAFLNHFRLAEVAERLRDPQQAHLPILSIALDVGYASIAPFNRAFRDAFGKTPSEYRHGLAGSTTSSPS